MKNEDRESTHKEVGVLRQLTHPYIVQYFDAFIDLEKLFIVMEFADAGDLSSDVRARKERQEPYDDSSAMKIFGHCVMALSYIHAKRIIHRDIKTQNIFLNKGGDAKLGDFGISKVLQATATKGTMTGTPSYLAPEMCAEEKYSNKVDVWAMGVVLYELVALVLPFSGTNVLALVMKIMNAEAEPLPSGTSDEIRSIVNATLQKEAENRPSADELLQLPAVSAVLPSETNIASSMDNFVKIKVLGRGSFGVAILVRQKNATNHAERVIKTVDLAQLHSEEARKKAQDEVELLRRLAHPHIIAYFDSFIEKDTLHIVLEYADGGDLSSVLRDRESPYDEKEALRIFGQCLDALRYVHKKHVLHRDIKGQNVFLMDKTKDVKIGDFGISKVMQDTLAEATELVGTPSYFAPELCLNKPYDSKVDIWAMGIILYELVTKVHPFQGSNIGATILKIVKNKPTPLPDTCSEDIRKIVGEILQSEPENRPSAAELLERSVISNLLSKSTRSLAIEEEFGELDELDGTSAFLAGAEKSVGSILQDNLQATKNDVDTQSTLDPGSMLVTLAKSDIDSTTEDAKLSGTLPLEALLEESVMGSTVRSVAPEAMGSTIRSVAPDAMGSTIRSVAPDQTVDLQEALTLSEEQLSATIHSSSSSPVALPREPAPGATLAEKTVSSLASTMQADEELTVIERLAQEATGEEDKLLAVLDEITRMYREDGFQRIMSARMAIEHLPNLKEIQHSLEKCHVEENTDRGLARRVLRAAVNRQLMKQEEDEELRLRGDKVQTLHIGASLASSSSQPIHGEEVNARTKEVLLPASAAFPETGKRGTASSLAKTEPGSPDSKPQASEDLHDDGFVRLLQEAKETGGSLDSLQGLIMEMARLKHEEGIPPGELADAIKYVWDDADAIKRALHEVGKTLRRDCEEDLARKFLVKAIDARLMEQEEIEFGFRQPIESGARPTSARTAAGNALAAVRMHRQRGSGMLPAGPQTSALMRSERSSPGGIPASGMDRPVVFREESLWKK
eukprot:TRINITY_DN6388_c0_g1_i1.p1 TRINITY_DN6388_c0_g1~~TRINITY_DN6388_c0_g1_i1.p1  ORF type:complete len:1021 (+),score=225.65 TRINITY_DN6388_c0_g1_i1:108-3170(+)